MLASPTNIAKLILLSALSLGPVLYRDKLRSVLGGGGGAASAKTSGAGGVILPETVAEATADTEMQESHSTRTSGEVDDAHLLPLSYTAHDHSAPPTPAPGQLSHPITSTSSSSSSKASSEASSTVGDHDTEIAEPEEYAYAYESEEHEHDTTSSKKQRWSKLPWTMWNADGDCGTKAGGGVVAARRRRTER